VCNIQNRILKHQSADRGLPKLSPLPAAAAIRDVLKRDRVQIPQILVFVIRALERFRAGAVPCSCLSEPEDSLRPVFQHALALAVALAVTLGDSRK